MFCLMDGYDLIVMFFKNTFKKVNLVDFFNFYLF